MKRSFRDAHLFFIAMGLATMGCQPPSEGGAPVVRLTQSADPALPRMNVTQWNPSRLLALDDSGGLHAVFTQLGSTNIEYQMNQPDPLDVSKQPSGQAMYKRSLDGGQSWSTETSLSPVAAGVDSPSLAAAGKALFLVFRAPDSASANRLRIVFRSSADSGVTWTPAVAISDNPAGISVSPATLAVAQSGSATAVYVVWSDARPQMVAGQLAVTNEIYLASSSDGGVTWKPVQAVSQPDGFSSWTPAVGASGSAVHVAWTDERNDLMECTKGGACHEEEYYRRSLDGGVTWGAETRLTFDPPGAPKESWAPSLVVLGNAVHLAFMDRRTDVFQVYYKRSLDGGASFEADVPLSAAQPPLSAARPNIAVLGADVHVAWFEFQDFPADIHYRRSTDSGMSFGADVNVTRNFPNAARLPAVAAAPDHGAHVIWYDTRNSDSRGPRTEIYYARPSG